MSVRSSGYVFSEPDDLGSLSATTGRSSIAVRELLQPVGHAAHRLAQRLLVNRAYVDEPVDAPRAQPLRRHGPDAPQRLNGQTLQKRLDAIGSDDGETIGLLPSRRDLREELVRRDAGRRRQPVASRMRSFNRFATVVASGSFQLFSVTSRYASSSDKGSTSGVTSR